jgi:hypothetical protein
VDTLSSCGKASLLRTTATLPHPLFLFPFYFPGNLCNLEEEDINRSSS